MCVCVFGAWIPPFGRFVTTDLVGVVFSGAFSVAALQVRFGFGFGVWLAA